MCSSTSGNNPSHHDLGRLTITKKFVDERPKLRVKTNVSNTTILSFTQVQWYYECGQEIISNSYLLPLRYRIVSIPEVRQKSCSKIHATIIPPISTSLRFGIPCEASLFRIRLDVQMFFRQLLFCIPLPSHFLQNSA